MDPKHIQAEVLKELSPQVAAIRNEFKRLTAQVSHEINELNERINVLIEARNANAR